MRIGELSERTGISIRMLRYYEAEGLLSPDRTGAGYRHYGPSDEEAVHQIKTLSATGMTLSAIRDFLPCALKARGEFESCDELRVRLVQQIERVDRRMGDLVTSRRALEAILAKL
jgi:DNA-binding transcriptional MerR regulator